MLHLKHIIVTTEVVPEHFKQSLTPFHVNGILHHNFSVFVQGISQPNTPGIKKLQPRIKKGHAENMYNQNGWLVCIVVQLVL